MPYTLEDKFSTVQSTLRELSRQPMSMEGQKMLHSLLDELDGYSGGPQSQAQTEHEEQGLAALYRVSRSLGSSLDLDEVLNQVMDAVIGLTNAERGFLVLLEGDAESWNLRAARNYDHETLQPKDMEISRTIVNRVLQNGTGLLTTDERSAPRFSGSESVILCALRSILCAPLLSRGNAIGAIFVDSRAHVRLFTQADLELLNAFAVQAAVAIENARLYTRIDQALARRVEELETLARIDQDLNRRLDYEHVVEITHRWVLEVSAADQAWVLLFQDHGSDERQLESYPRDFVDLEAPPIIAALNELTPQQLSQDADPNHRLVVPVLHSGAPLGVLVLDRSQSFSDSDVRYLSHLCGRAAAAIETARLYQAVQSANLAKSRFVSVVSHELRVPMTSIKGYADLMRQGVVGPLNEQQIDFIDIIRNNVERMATLVSDLADISRIETGRLRLEISRVEIGDYLEDTLTSLRPKLEEKQQRLTIDIPHDMPEIRTDPNRLVQVLTNLISNASKYSPVNGEIRIQAADRGKGVQIEVIDNGIGISPEDQARLFTQFFRSDDPAVREEQGWGLGLNVSKLLVDLMGGEMGFQSTPGSGSTFWFRLPYENDRVGSESPAGD